MLSPVDATGEDTLGALHYEGLRRGIIFFAALFLLILPGIVAARYGRPEPGFAETRRVNPVHGSSAPLGSFRSVMPRNARSSAPTNHIHEFEQLL
jgi:hypothetical protein